MAASAGLNPLPPSVVHSTSRLTHLQAHTLLSRFLETAENDAAYRPDSTLTERGPQALSSSSSPNLTLAHLKRILLGIEGKRVGGGVKLAGEESEREEVTNLDVDAEAAESLQVESKQNGNKKRELEEAGTETSRSKKQKKISSSDEATDIPPSNQEAVTDEWQDPAILAQAQEIPYTPNDTTTQNGIDEEAEQAFDDLTAVNDIEIEQARNPSAGLKQPHSKEEERELVSIRLEGTGEVVDSRIPHGRNGEEKSGKKKKKRKDEAQRTAEAEETESAKLSGKKKKKGKEVEGEDQDRDLDVAAASSPIVTATPQTPWGKNVNVEDDEDSNRALSKEERKKLKKMRHKDTKRDREEVRLKKKGEQ